MLVEVKRAAGGLPETLPETICAFANMPGGGTIILGVDERSGFQVTGLSDPTTMEAGLIDQARKTVSPAPSIFPTILTIDGRDILIAEIDGLPIMDRPAKVSGRAYLRQSDGDYRMADHELRMIEVAKLHADEQVHYDDRELSGTSIDELDAGLLKQFLRLARENNRRLRSVDDDAALLRLLRVTTSTGELTLAGSYALGFFPQGSDPALSVTAAVQLPRDGSGIRTRNLETFTGPVPVLFEDLLNWVRSNISSEQVYASDGGMSTRYEFPMSAVREAIANALVHRDLGPDTLGLGKSVEIRLTDLALEIHSPGGLRGLTVQQLRSLDLSRAAVNQRLYEIVKNLRTSEEGRIIEGEGGGIREMFAAAREAELPPPELVDAGVRFIVKLWRGSVFSEEHRKRFAQIASGGALSFLQKTVLSSLWNGEHWTLARVQREFSPIDEDRARAQLDQLVALGQISINGSGDIQDLRAANRPDSRPEEASRHEVESLTSRELQEMGRNVPIIFGLLREAVTGDEDLGVSRLSEQSGLSLGQVRYALKPLLERELVVMQGIQGKRETTYRLNLS